MPKIIVHASITSSTRRQQPLQRAPEASSSQLNSSCVAAGAAVRPAWRYRGRLLSRPGSAEMPLDRESPIWMRRRLRRIDTGNPETHVLGNAEAGAIIHAGPMHALV